MIKEQDKKPGPNDGVMTISRLSAPSTLNAVRRVNRRGKQAFDAPHVQPEPVAIKSVANAETVARWAAERAARVELDKKAEKDRKAAYRKLHTPIAGNPAKRTGGVD